jgi:hypothetical protein
VHIIYPISRHVIQSKLSPKLSVAENTSISIASVIMERYTRTREPRSHGGHPILMLFDIEGMGNLDIIELAVFSAPILGRFGIIYAICAI